MSSISTTSPWMSIRFLLVFGLVTILFLPFLALADLVPCEGAGCKTCHISETVNGVIKWLVNIMAILCAIIIIVAGFQMVTAQGSMEKVSHARSLITNALIGFVILLGAWLIVDTVLKVLLSGNDQSATAPAQLPGFGPWNSIQCSESPAATAITGPTAPIQDSGSGMLVGAAAGMSAIVDFAQEMQQKGCIYNQALRNACQGTPGYTDCSDLVNAAYTRNGCRSPGSSTATQYPNAQPIGEKASLRPGD